MLTRINSMQSKYQSMVAEASALWSIVDLIDRAKAEREPTGGSETPSLDRAVELRDVCISYDGQPVLDRLCLELPAGCITAIAGPSGTGKTTIVDLITGLVDPESGEVLVDGVPLREIDLRAWRGAIGYVPQETILLNDSIRTNVSFGDPAVTDVQIEKALRDADLWGFVARLPDGVDTSVGERGALLSGGQRQRVAVARALVHKPRLLILDEATSALDAASESEIWASVVQLRGRTTVVAISHQPALVAIADRVYRIENGHAIEAAPTARSERFSQEVA
jgi:ATP-binding cassette subfamily C protein